MKLTTDRLLLRTFKPTDIDERYLGWLQDREVTRFSNQRFRNHSAESCSAYLEGFSSSANSFLLITHKGDQVPIGTMTIYRSLEHGTADMGLMLGDRHYWRQGLGLEAWEAALKFSLHNNRLRKVTGGTARPNKGMVRIMEECGMSLEAVKQRQEIINGEAVDLLYYAKFSDELA